MRNKKKKLPDDLPLLENGLDFLELAVSRKDSFTAQDSKTRDDMADVKTSLIFLHAAMELFLKQVLALEHWSLVCADRKKLSKEDFEEGSVQTVGMEEAADRIATALQSPLPEHQLLIFKRLRNMRNQAYHFHIDRQKQHCSVILSDALGACLEFVGERFPLSDLPEGCQQSLARIRSVLRDLGEFSTRRVGQVRDAAEVMSADSWRTVCVHCNENYSFLLEQEVRCLFCGSRQKGLALQCPLCEEKALLLGGTPTCHACGFTEDAESVKSHWLDFLGRRLSEIDIANARKAINIAFCGRCDQCTLVPTYIDELTEKPWGCGLSQKCLTCGYDTDVTTTKMASDEGFTTVSNLVGSDGPVRVWHGKSHGRTTEMDEEA